MKNRKKIVLTTNQRCWHHTESLLLRFFKVHFFNRFFEVDEVGRSLKTKCEYNS